ncbi:UNVERIFIED_CONTAM: hypothetical protein NY603_26235, partial [Bacteroidetes bacterium 56_B9]
MQRRRDQSTERLVSAAQKLATIETNDRTKGCTVDSSGELLQATACDVVERLKRGEVTPQDLL